MSLLRIAARVAGVAPAPSIYVDLDETLVHSVRTDRDPEKVASLVESGLEHSEISDGMYMCFLRPGARELLQELGSIGDVAICTAATRPYAEQVLSAFGLAGSVWDVVTREDLGSSLAVPGHVVLVDNLSEFSRDVQDKLGCLGASWSDPDGLDEDAAIEAERAHYGRHFVRVKDFWGDPADSELRSVPQRVRAAIS